MNEYWEITHERAVATQAVWNMKPAFELNALTRTQHGTLCDSLPTLVQTRDNKANDLTDALAAKHTLFNKLTNIGNRVPGLIDATLSDEDPLKEQLDAIYAVDGAASENHAMRRGRVLLPLWLDINTARAAATPAKPEITVDHLSVVINASNFAATMVDGMNAQKTEAEKSRDVTNAKSALRAADRKTDRGNKRWYKAWLKAYPAGTAEGDAALSQIPTEQGVDDAEPLEILTLTAQANHTVLVNLDPAGGAHATTKELQYLLPGEPEFGHTTPITGNQMTTGPLTVGVMVTFRTRVANSNPGTVSSATQAVVVI